MLSRAASRLKKVFTVLSVTLSTFNLPIYAGSVNIHVQDGSGGAISGADIYAINFTNQGPDATKSKVGTTNGSGDVTLSLSDADNFDILADKQGVGPTARIQMFNQHPHIPGNQTGTTNITLNTTITGRGTITAHVTNGSANKFISGNVQKDATHQDVAFGACITNGAGACDIVFKNVPAAAANIYNVGVFDQSAQKGYGSKLNSVLAEGGSASLALDLNNGMRPDMSAGNADRNNTSDLPGATVEVQVVDGSDATKNPAGGWIEIRTRASDGHGGYTVNQRGGAPIDQNGRARFNGLTADTYFVDMSPGCTQDGLTCYQGVKSNVWSTGVTGADDFVINSTNETNKDRVIKTMTVTAAPDGAATMMVIVQDEHGNHLPWSHVSLNPDGSPWMSSAPACNGSDNPTSNAAYSRREDEAADGTITFQKLTPGRYNLWVNSQFSQQGKNFNAGANGLTDFSGVRGCTTETADDLSLLIQNDNTVKVKNTSGANVTSMVSTVGGVTAITVTVPTNNAGADGHISGKVSFANTTDMSAHPMVLVAHGDCDQSGCTGGFATLSGSAKEFTYQIDVPATKSGNPANYFLEFLSDYNGIIQDGGGNMMVTLSSSKKTITRDFKGGPAGMVTGTVYKPDGSPFIPGPDASGTYVSGEINARGQHSWGHGRIAKDGTFTIGGLQEGEYQLVPQFWGGSNNYTVKKPPVVNVTVNQKAAMNISLSEGQFVKPSVDGHLPTLLTTGGSDARGEALVIYQLPQGAPLDEKFIGVALTHQDEDAMIRDNPAYTGGGRCGNNWPGGFCPQIVPDGTTRKMVAAISGDMGSVNVNGTKVEIYPYLRLLDSKDPVTINKQARSGVTMTYNGSTINPIRPTFDAKTVSDGVTFTGSVVAEHMFRPLDFSQLNGDFNNFIKFIPTVALYNTKGQMIAAGLVTPPPSLVGGDTPTSKKIDEAVANNDFTAFKTVLDGAEWKYAVRHLPPNENLLVVFKTPNYPFISMRIKTGDDGSVVEKNINWDTLAGAGGAIAMKAVDTGGNPIPNASFVVKARGLEKALTGDSAGKALLEGLAMGSYKVTGSANGYAPAAAKVSISNTDTTDVTLTLKDGPGSISGTVRELTADQFGGMLQIPLAGARVVGVDATIAAADKKAVLPLYSTQSGSDGTYKIKGLIAGHSIKIYYQADGRNTESLDVDATGADVPNQDVVLKQSKLRMRLEIAYSDTVERFLVKLLNVKNFSSGDVWFYPSTQSFDAATATKISDRFTSLPDGSLVGYVTKAEITADVIYNLRVAGYPADGGETVVVQQQFGTAMTRNLREDLSKAMLGIDGENEIADDKKNGVEFEPVSVQSGSSTDDPTITITSQDSDGVTNNGSNEPIGDAVTFTFGNTNNTDIPVPVCIAFDPNQLVGNDIPDLQLLTYNANTHQWEKLPDSPTVTIDPLTLTACADINLNTTVSSQLPLNGSSAQAGVKTRAVAGRMSAINTGHKFVRNAAAATSGAMTLAVGVANNGGIAATAYHQYNFPNPFNLKDKTVSLRAGTAGVPTSVRGTYIVISPTGAGTTNARIRIYNVAGDMVREFNTPITRGQYNYIEWDGRNTSGDDVASGVYFASVDAPGAPKKKPIKMVVVK